MGYKIEYSYKQEFVDLMESLREKYGQKLFDIDGIGHQLDFNSFSKNYFSSKVTSDASVDANANVDDTSVISFVNESPKPAFRLDSYYMLWKQMKKQFSLEEANDAVEKQLRGDIYINDFHGISASKPYCFNYSTFDVLSFGLPMVNKITSLPPKHLLAFKSQIEQFITIAANGTLGATGLADMLISCAYYMKNILATKSDAHFHFVSEEDCWEYFRQTMVSFIYTVNQPSRGQQSPFTNISLYDDLFLESITKDIVFPDGSSPDIDIIKKEQIIYMDCMNEELSRTPITFPVTTACMTKVDGEIQDQEFVKLIAEKNMKYGFINIYIGETSTLSSCCRLRSSTNNEFFNSFGAGSSKIGSLGVATINFPRLAFLSENTDDFENKLREYVQLTAKINEAKRQIVKKKIDTGHIPLYTLGFMELSKQYSTTGVNGFYECLQILDKPILTKEGQDYAVRIMEILNEEIDKAQKRFKAPHNCEQIPGENASIKLCAKDKALGYELNLDLYSNQFVPLTTETDMLNRILIQGKLDNYFSGGSVLHLNIEEGVDNVQDLINLTNFCAKAGVVYFAFNYLLNKCKNNHMSIGHREICPFCGEPIEGQFIRVVGFLTQVSYWHKVRREVDFPNRKFYHSGELGKIHPKGI